jgi:hypothetical protein
LEARWRPLRVEAGREARAESGREAGREAWKEAPKEAPKETRRKSSGRNRLLKTLPVFWRAPGGPEPGACRSAGAPALGHWRPPRRPVKDNRMHPGTPFEVPPAFCGTSTRDPAGDPAGSLPRDSSGSSSEGYPTPCGDPSEASRKDAWKERPHVSPGGLEGNLEGPLEGGPEGGLEEDPWRAVGGPQEARRRTPGGP